MVHYCVDYLALFLGEDDQIPPLPPGVVPGDPDTTAWLTEVKRLTVVAWEAFGRFWVEKCGRSKPPPDQTNPFRNFLEEVGPALWPQGPRRSSVFGVRDRDFLVDHWNGKQEQRANKRRRINPPVEDDNEEGESTVGEG